MDDCGEVGEEVVVLIIERGRIQLNTLRELQVVATTFDCMACNFRFANLKLTPTLMDVTTDRV